MAYRLEQRGSGLVFTIDRPEKRNAVNDEVMDGLSAAISEAEENDSLRFFAVTGAGDSAFCSGGDLSEFHRLKTADEAAPMLGKMAAILLRMSRLPVPVIALINGHAVGGGCEIATACDYRLVREEAKCGYIQGTLAITTGWGGASHLFVKTGGHAPALRMLTEAKVHTAGELLSSGWATETFAGDPAEALDRFTDSLSRIDPGVIRAYKQAAVRKSDALGLAEMIREEVEECARLWEADAHHEAVDRFLNKKY
ncbi:enoyl-CoA hydratase/isomerase family protein [Bhargavaea cecembensis]|uniref:enoyl-CoA hydratase/isomerase family protein n=1 Tax=Bhargavaea cecembensis TaxID=394098 RepID=UPI00058D76FF|nr:enoyl-CoA hydratase/isomerase family protein [Bhargavaea cecembensis]